MFAESICWISPIFQANPCENYNTQKVTRIQTSPPKRSTSFSSLSVLFLFSTFSPPAALLFQQLSFSSRSAFSPYCPSPSPAQPSHGKTWQCTTTGAIRTRICRLCGRYKKPRGLWSGLGEVWNTAPSSKWKNIYTGNQILLTNAWSVLLRR